MMLRGLAIVSLACWALFDASLLGQGARQNPYGPFYQAVRIAKQGPAAIRKTIAELLKQDTDNASTLCLIAELMKRVGDYRAEEYYRRTIKAAPSEPAYELFFADYLRNFRGPQRPLFPGAEQHYWEAVRKLKALGQLLEFDRETERRVWRGLIALYQQSGIPLLYAGSRPLLFFSSLNRYQESSEGLDGPDEVRDFTSEALFSSGRLRLDRALTRDELRSIIRKKPQFESVNRLRLRYRRWPSLEVSYRRRDLSQAQIANFFEPGGFAAVEVEDVGLSLEKPFDGSPFFDFYLRGEYRNGRRRGLIEFLPQADEEVDQFEAEAAASRFLGPDKLNLQFVYVYQQIDPDPFGLAVRERRVLASRVSYQIFRPIPFLQPEDAFRRRFSTRGIDLFGGFLRDREDFGGVLVERRDFFLGAALQSLGAFDVTFQGTVFSSKVLSDRSQDNSQYRANLTILYRLLDEEGNLGLPDQVLGVRPAFFHLVFPLRYDFTRDGPPYFESFRAGARLAGKVFSGRRRPVTFLFSVGFEWQRFYRLDRSLYQFDVSFNLGFR